MKNDFRNYPRFPVPQGALACEGVDRTFDGPIVVLGLGGMFVNTRERYPAGTSLTVRIRGNDAVVETECVVRDVEAEGIGVEFMRLRGKDEENLKKILSTLQD